MSDRPILRTILVSLAIVLAGLAIGGGVQRFRLADRSVTGGSGLFSANDIE